MLTLGKQERTPQQRLDKAVSDIMNREIYRPLAGLMMVGDRLISDKVPTAATNGRDEWYNADFVQKVLHRDAYLRFVLLHECRGHKMLKHLTAYRKLYDINARLANMACDYYINLKIMDENPDGWATIPLDENGKVVGLLDEKYRGKSVTEIFLDLQENQGEEGDGDGDGDGEGFDEHDWEGAKELTDGEKKELEQQIDDAVRQGQILAGKTGSSDTLRDIEEMLQTQVDWREVLREFISNTCAGKDYSTYAKPNRRYMGTGVYMPSSVSEKVEDIVIAIDTSYSIGQKELQLFITELVEVCERVNPNKVHIMYWGTEVVSHEIYLHDELNNIHKTTKPRGGGGTMVECVPDYMREKNVNAECAIVLTDGYLGGDWGQWDVPVLWCVLDNKNAVASNGKTVHIKSEDM